MTNDYGIYLTADKTTIRFPVNPEEIAVKYPGKNERFDVLGLGEIVQPRLPGLAEVSWSDALLPGTPEGDYVLTKGAFKPPEYYISFLTRCMQKQLRATLVIDRRREDGFTFYGPYGGTVEAELKSQLVVVEDFEVQERGGETGDFYYSITFAEYRDYAPKTITLVADASVPNAVTAVAESPRSIPPGQLSVGVKVTVNGKFYYTSYQKEPHGNGNGRTAVVGKIITTDPSRPCPILLKSESGGLLGWCGKDAVSTQ